MSALSWVQAARRAGMGLLALPLALWAQVPNVPPSLDPGAAQQRQLDEQRRREEELRQRIPRVQRPLDTRANEPAQPDAAMLAMRLRVQQIEFSPSRFLAGDELAALARPLVGREVSLGELLAMVEQVNALYRERGIATARALLPAQDVTDGRVQVRLVEATLGRIGIDGNASTREGFITERIAAQPAQVVDPRRLERDLVRFNRLHDVQLRARLEPGREAGATDLMLDVLEPPAHVLRVSLDNTGSPGTGRERLSLSALWRSPLGVRDEWSANLSASDGTRSLSLGAGAPLNRWDTRVGAQLAYDEHKVRHGAFAALNLNGHATTGSVTLRQPLLAEDRHLLEASLAWRERRSVNRAEQVPLLRSALQDVTLGLDGSTWIGPVATSLGLQWSDVDARVSDATGATDARGYSVRRASLRGTWSFRPLWTLNATLSAQDASATRLPAADQFYQGGDGTVRGYSASVVGGDRGESVNLELHHPLPAVWQAEGRQFSGVVFWDAGRVKPFRATGSTLPAHDLVRGVGWGLNVQWGASLQGRLVLAHAIDRPPSETLGRDVVHLLLTWQLP
jgi:hemolysin activation/secretion protein